MTAFRIRNVCNSDAEANRRADMGMVMIGKSTALAVAIVAAGANVAASKPPMTEEQAAAGVRGKVIGFTAAQLAMSAHRTKSAAKGWIAPPPNHRCPTLATAINLARSLPCVREWLYSEIGEHVGALTVEHVIRWATDHRLASDEAGSVARAILGALAEPEKKPPAESAWRPDNVVRDLFRVRA